jgi:hypothetical protein
MVPGEMGVIRLFNLGVEMHVMNVFWVKPEKTYKEPTGKMVRG